jgi:hypothetical protein
MKYAKSTGGFYEEAIHGDAIPEDAVEVSAAEHAALFAAQAEGKVITADASGRPVATDVVLTDVQVWATAQQNARNAMAKSDLVLLRCLEAGIPLPAAWKTYRTALRAILGATSGDGTKPLPTAPAYPA